jgi:predicted Zn-dependent protease
MALKFSVFFLATIFCLSAFAADKAAQLLREKAYRDLAQNLKEQAANEFQQYLKQNPDDTAVALDYANLLSQLNRPADAAKVLEDLHQKHPQNETAYFKLGNLYVSLNRWAGAEKVFQDLSHSSNADLAAAANEALRNVQSQLAHQSRQQAEQHVFELAAQFKYVELLDAVAVLEKQGPLPFAIEMQRLYAMEMLGRYAPALARADALTKDHPKATDLALLRADLLVQLGRRPEAQEIWKTIQRENAGTQAALIASERQKGMGRPEENLVFELARQQKYQDALEAINKLERQDGKLSWAMEMQRLYVWQSLGQKDQALERANTLAQTHPASNDLAFFRADILMSRHEWEEASQILKDVKARNPNSEVTGQAQNRLDSIPPIANLDKWYWGEAYLSGEYSGRFGTLIGSGLARHGYFIPHARWLQPYIETRFTVDTRSTAGRERTIIADNFLGFSAGVRAQPFPSEYFFFYISTGINKDLLDLRHHGDWAWDSQGGVYGFKSWGPGTMLLSTAPGEAIPATGNLPATIGMPDIGAEKEAGSKNWFFWRGDWFVDAGADFSYYQRYSSWIGYGQAHEGFRLFQITPHAAIDAYAVENLSWDVRGNYFDNLAEVGPGVRLLWVPRRHIEVVLRGEYLNGYYLGRDDLHNRGGASEHYDEFRAALTLGLRW